ncbi:MAG TPA: isoleucine--tRNA ligase [Chloroflexota bacterium]|nr:isoleucine--tRNA ligase [Chloroflexota bacterium]
MFKPVDIGFNVPELEHEVIDFWQRNEIEAKYLRKNDGSRTRFSFIDGPMTANGRMGVHHAWGRTYKDLWQRYNTMLGHRQRYQNGFDCQGLWVEVTVERELGFASKRDIESYGIDRFIRKCKESVFANAATITAQSKRLGYFMDWDNSYYTLSDENNYTIWHFLKTCHEHGWLYKGTDVMPWCVRCGTGLSEHEINTSEYAELTHTSVFVKFPLLDRPDESLLVWTTTPWTLTSNVAAAVNPGADPQTGEPVVYVRARTPDGDVIYAARESLPTIGGAFTIEAELTGDEMLGWRYRGPFDELPVQNEVEHRVIPWSEVSASEGTGIVHIAPGAGKEDFALGRALTLPAIAPLDENGVYVSGFDWLTGRNVLEVSDDIVEDLRGKSLLFRAHEFTHRYPTCWRCQTPLVFRLVDEWFISMAELRERMMRAAEQIRWIPSWGLERELDWLRNMDDWMISKKRYWGLALPIFECGCGRYEVLGGKEELMARAVEGIEDLESPHRPWLDNVRIRCSACGDLVPRIKDVGNPWVDAGIVPFSTLNYTHDRDYWREWFPADFITESFPGQFRNWFYSLIAQSAALEDTNPFKTVLGYASLRDLNGREMHKSWGNDIPFDEAADGVGADIMRWLFCRHPPESNLNFGYSVLDGVKAKLLVLWNTYSFLVTYANLDHFDPGSGTVPVRDRPLLDRWIVARFNELVLQVRSCLDAYDAEHASGAIEAFVDDLSSWYVRRSRRRFWKTGLAGQDSDKRSAYVTLYETLTSLALVLAPFIPFISESLYQNLVAGVRSDVPESIHLCDYPTVDEEDLDRELLLSMAAARQIVSLGRAAREQAQIRVRQPLAAMYVDHPQGVEEQLTAEHRDIVLDELNVKELRRVPSDAQFVDYRVRPNLPLLGRRYGKEVQLIRSGLARLVPSGVAAEVEAGRSVTVEEDGRAWTLSPEEILVEAVRKEGFVAAADGGYLVALDTTLTPELRAEGLARELIRAVNDQRKNTGLRLDDRIGLTYTDASEGFVDAIAAFREWITQETLATAVYHRPELRVPGSELNVDGEHVAFGIVPSPSADPAIASPDAHG